mmetsp:Transcript_2868/g.5446  ORF Transcript_2868/g.5446 Transcript_2868/m.5446 type:complete len:133 (+) Transcript_2868:76-474(+)
MVIAENSHVSNFSPKDSNLQTVNTAKSSYKSFYALIPVRIRTAVRHYKMGGEENTHLKAMLQNQNQKILQNQNQQKILQNQVRDLQAQVSVLIGELTDSKSKERFKVLRGNWRGQNPESESEPAMMECNPEQ